MLFYFFLFFLSFRNGEPRSAWAGGPGLPHALSPGLPRVTPRDDEAVLEEGRGREAHLRVHPVLLRRLLHFHGAAVPARGQPLDWPLGEEGVEGWGGEALMWLWGTWVNIKARSCRRSWVDGLKPWWGCTERKRYWSDKLFYNHSRAKGKKM